MAFDQQAYMKEYYQKHKEKLKARAEYHRRRKGVAPATLTKTEQVVLACLREILPKRTVIRPKDFQTLLNPLTGKYLEIDFYIPSRRLAIEVNGTIHYEPIYGKERYERQQRNDQLKRELCEQQGIRLVEIRTESGQHYERSIKEYLMMYELVQAALN